jgi:hypothetical protein
LNLREESNIVDLGAERITTTIKSVEATLKTIRCDYYCIVRVCVGGKTFQHPVDKMDPVKSS